MSREESMSLEDSLWRDSSAPVKPGPAWGMVVEREVVEREILERAPLRYKVEALCERLLEETGVATLPGSSFEGSKQE